MITEKEAVLRERKAFTHGWMAHGGWEDNGQSRANREYRLPKVTRPRVVRDPHQQGNDLWFYRFNDGVLETRSVTWKPEEWCPAKKTWLDPTPERIRLWASLLDQPLETVEDEG